MVGVADNATVFFGRLRGGKPVVRHGSAAQPTAVTPRCRKAAPAAFLLAGIAWTQASQAGALPDRQLIAIVAVTVVDLEHERTPAPRTVLIDDGRIVSISDPRTARIPAQARRIDGRGRFLIPGLVDMHVHLFNTSSRRPPNTWTFPLFVANGVTAVREMNADTAAIAQVQQWRRELDSGTRLLPRILAAGVAVHGRSPDDAAAQVDAAADAGADFVKVFSDIPLAHWRAALAAASRRSIPLAGHAPAHIPLLSTAMQGQSSNEHLMQAFEACSPIENRLIDERGTLDSTAGAVSPEIEETRVLQAFDAPRCRRVGAVLATTRQVQIVTLVLPHGEAQRRAKTPADDPRWRYLRADERLRWQRLLASVDDADSALARRRWSVARRIASLFRQAGVTLLAGTDAPMPGIYPGFSLHDELALLVDAGLSPRAALRSATLLPAQFLGIAATAGSVAVGKRADLLLLDADPARNIRNTRRIRAVVLDGRLLTRESIDALLDDAAQARADEAQG